MEKRIVLLMSIAVLVFLSVSVVSATGDSERERGSFLNAILEFFSFQWLYQLTSTDYGEKVILSDVEGVELEFKGDLTEKEKLEGYNNLKGHISKLTPITKDILTKIEVVPEDSEKGVEGIKTFDFIIESDGIGSPCRIGLMVEYNIKERNFRRALAYWLPNSFDRCGGFRPGLWNELNKVMKIKELYYGTTSYYGENGKMSEESLFKKVDGEIVYAQRPDYKGPAFGVMNPSSLYSEQHDVAYFVDAIVGEPDIFKDLLVETNEWYEVYRGKLDTYYRYGFYSYEEYKKPYEYAGLRPQLREEDKLDILLIDDENKRLFGDIFGDCSDGKCTARSR